MVEGLQFVIPNASYNSKDETGLIISSFIIPTVHYSERR